MRIDLDDQSLIFLTLTWDAADFDPKVKDLIQSYETLWFLRWQLVKETIGNNHKETSIEQLKKSLRSQTDRLLNSLSDIILDIKPKYVPEFTEKFEDIQSKKFEEILLTIGEAGKYREHLRHQKRVFFLGVLLIERFNLGLLDKPTFREFWYPVACLHDFCYILQEIENIARRLADDISKTFPKMKFIMNVTSRFGSEFIAEKQKKILASIAGGSNEDYFSLLEKVEDRDHGIMSALFVYDSLFEEKSGITKDNLDKITRAIAFHTNGRSRCKVKCDQDPLACLLILCDEVQEWKRPSAGRTDSYVEKIYLNNLSIESSSWGAEETFINKLINEKSLKTYQYQFQLGNNKFNVEFFLKFNPDTWIFETEIKGSSTKKLDEQDLQAFQKELTADLNRFASSLFAQDVNKRISEEDLKLKLGEENKIIEGNIPLIGRMAGLPPSRNKRIFDILFPWLLLNYVRKEEPGRSTLNLKILNDNPLEFLMPHLINDESNRKQKTDNLRRIDYTNKEDYKKIRISSGQESQNNEKKVILFPPEQEASKRC